MTQTQRRFQHFAQVVHVLLVALAAGPAPAAVCWLYAVCESWSFDDKQMSTRIQDSLDVDDDIDTVNATQVVARLARGRCRGGST